MFLPKPAWLRRSPGGGVVWKGVAETLTKYGLSTVCQGALCPNRGECWGTGTAAFLLLGDTCTRSCRFCAVPSAREGRPLEADEGERIARAAEELALSYVVLTSVDRDDLPDRGARHFAACMRAIRSRLPGVQVEVLTPDYGEGELEPVAAAGAAVLAHNVETVRSLQHIRDRRASFDRSLATLRAARSLGFPLTKSSILLGLGEEEGEVFSAMDELREAAVDILVLGQYLRPSAAQIAPKVYLHPDVFSRYREEALGRGFSRVVSSPLARTSYHAGEPVAQGPTAFGPPALGPPAPEKAAARGAAHAF